MIVTTTTFEELFILDTNYALFSLSEEAEGEPSNYIRIHKASARSVDGFKLES